MPKKTKKGTFGIFQHPFCRKISKNLRGDPSVKKKLRKKVSQSRKYSKGVPFGTVEFLR